MTLTRNCVPGKLQLRYGTPLPSLLSGIAIRLRLFRADRGDPVELLDRAAWIPYYLLIIGVEKSSDR